MSVSPQKTIDTIRRSEFFDAQWYLAHYPDVAALNMDPAEHFVRLGALLHRNPGPGFDTRHYISTNPDVVTSGLNPLFHYLTKGRAQGRQPLPHGTVARTDPAPKLTLTPLAPKRPKKSAPSAPASREEALRHRLVDSGLFNAEWYASEYTDVIRLNINPLRHFLRHGAVEGRNPSPDFDTAWYKATYGDDLSDPNPLIDYIETGREKGRLPRPPLQLNTWWSNLHSPVGRRAGQTSTDAAVNYGEVTQRLRLVSEPPAILIPVHNALEATQACIESVLRHTALDYRLIIIDDASTDARVRPMLETFRDIEQVELYFNESNLGFSGTVNRGIRLAGRSDVVFLNSDTLVTPGWLGNMRLAAYSTARTATVTAMSNNAGAFSVPEPGSNDLPAGVALDDYARALAQTSLRLYPTCPTGNGFCLYVRRDCLDEVGELDEAAFPRGYGEENDFCMRAMTAGWRHVIDDATFVYHVRSASFGEEKNTLMAQGRAVVDARYPTYTAEVKKFTRSENLKTVRARVASIIEAVRTEPDAVKPRALYVLSTRTGGTPQTNQDLMTALDDRYETLVMRCNARAMTLMLFKDGDYLELERYILKTPVEPYPHRSPEYDLVAAQWLTRYNVELVHIRHIAWHSLGLIDEAKALNLPVIFSFHDFYNACPTVKLLDEKNVFCGGKCTATMGECAHELWNNPDFPPLKHASIRQWQRQFNQALEKCDAFVTTARFARETIANTFSATRNKVFEVIPHGRDFAALTQLGAEQASGAPLRVLVPGNISTAKGADIIHDLVEFASQNGIEFHIMGQIFDKLTLFDPENTPGLVVHGAYEREQFESLVASIRPHLGAVLSIWPETFCHTLTELWACGLPVIGFDTGAVGERIRETGGGWALEEISTDSVRRLLQDILKEPAQIRAKAEKVEAWQTGEGLRDCAAMARDYTTLYDSIDITRRARTAHLPQDAHGFQALQTPVMRPVAARQVTTYDVDIVIPVYNALPFVKLCLASIQSHKDGLRVRTIVVNDGSQPETSAWLREFANETPDVVLKVHETNKGYTTAVNTGLKLSTAPYVITLNSDTEVTRGWLSGMIRCFASDARIGIVGPLSNAASWQNVPTLYDETGAFAINEIPDGLSADDFAAVVAEASDRVYPRAPFANGFCYMIRREVIDTVGYMDQAAFPIGYGEENDYCIRAAAAGYTLAYADDAYVFHAKSKSFGHDKRKELARAGSKALRAKHGTEKVEALIDQVKITKVMDGVRQRISDRLSTQKARPVRRRDFTEISVLFLLPVKGAGGGVHSIVQEATEMRRLGINAAVAVNKEDVGYYLDLYNDMSLAPQVFVGIEENSVTTLASHYDIVVATIFLSIPLLNRIYEANPNILPAYYIQDYEPWFFPRGNKHWIAARESYELIPTALNFAKTYWIAGMVGREHDVPVHKVQPSLDHAVYKPAPRITPGLHTISAMIRPLTPRRGADRTMRLLKRLHQRYGSRIDIHIFGCAEDSPGFDALERDFPYTNHAHLKRLGVAGVLGRSDIFLDLSDYQAFGRTALEAMACGCIPLVPLLGGADEFAVDGENAIVADTSDEEACFGAICALLDEPATIAVRQRLALKTAARFSIHSAAVSELTLFQEALEARDEAVRTLARRQALFVPALTKGGKPTGSAHVRLLSPYRQAAVRQAWDVRISDENTLPSDENAAVIVIQRDVPNVSAAEIDSWAKAAHAKGQRIIYETDDDLLDLAGMIKRGYAGDTRALADRVNALARNADAVTVSTDALRARFSSLNKNVRLVPNYLDNKLWQLNEAAPATKPRTGGITKIGYIGTPSHVADLALIGEAMADIKKIYGAMVEIEVIGGFQDVDPLFGTRIGLPKKNEYPDFVGWLYNVVDWDIGLIPLVDDDFNRAKSNLKFLEYSALGLASIVSDVPTYEDVVVNRENALSVQNNRQAWKKAVTELIENPGLRDILAKNARTLIRKQYGVRHHKDLYLDILKGS